MRPTSWTFSLDMGECGFCSNVLELQFGPLGLALRRSRVSFLRRQLLVISGADWRKSDPVAAASRVHVVRSGCPWADARSRLRARAVSLWPRPLRFHHMAKRHARSGPPPPTLFLFFESVILKWFIGLSFTFWQNKYTTSGNRWQTISTFHTTMALSCIMEGELLFKAT